jgi:hypothetical protein
MRRNRWTPHAAFLALSVTLMTAACAPQGPRTSTVVARPSGAHLAEAYGRLPLHFEENRGQADPSTRFIARAGGDRVLLGTNGLQLAVDGHPVRLSFAGRTAEPKLHTLDPLPGRVNYYVGTDAAHWRTDIPTFSRIRYAEVYPGVDVVMYGNQRQLEYDFVVAPGADPRAIRVRIDGADAVTVDAAGDVSIRRGNRTIVQRAPVVYQQIDRRRERVAARYRLAGVHELAFDVGSYDRSRALIIDPVVVFSARIGVGTAFGIAVDRAGYAYFGGQNTAAFNNEYPMVNAAFPQRVTGLEEIFVTKLSPDGATLIYSTYIGSSFRDFLNGIATDGAGNAYITGRTHSGYPTTASAFQPTTVGGSEDGSVSFVTKFGPMGALVYSTFLDGTTFDNPADPIRGGGCYQGEGNSIAADAAGNAYVVGWTSTNNFPTTPGAFIPTKPTTGIRCTTYPAGYLTQLAPDGASLVYSTYLDGNGAGLSVALDGAGNAYVGAKASTPSAPPGALTASLAASGATTGFYVAKFNPAGFPTQTTVIGAWPEGISVGADGSTYVAGGESLDFTTIDPIQTAPTGGGFASRLNPTGTAWMWSTYLSGSMASIAAAPDGSAWVVGATDDDNFPTKDPLRTKTMPIEAVVLTISPTGSLLFSSPLGDGAAFGVAVDNAGGAYITGRAGADFMPTTPGAYSAPPSAGFDVFVLKLNNAALADAPPTVSITSPSRDVWTGNSINVAATASDNAALANIKLWADGAVFATIPCSGTTCSGEVLWITGSLPPAAYEVNAVATDTAGNQAVSGKVTIYKDATSPVQPSGATATGGGGGWPPTRPEIPGCRRPS